MHRHIADIIDSQGGLALLVKKSSTDLVYVLQQTPFHDLINTKLVLLKN